jgi:hypothetical protein
VCLRHPDAGQSRQLPRFGEFNGRHETVPLPWNTGEVSAAWLAVAQYPSQRSDLDFEVGLFDDDVGPDAGHELLLAHELSGALDQHVQDFQGPSTDPNGSFTFQQELLCRKKAERAERRHAL